MFKMKAGLILFVMFLDLCFFSANAWDIAVAVKDTIRFMDVSSGEVGRVSDGMMDVSGLAYHQDLRRMYFVDNKRAEASVFEVELPLTFSNQSKSEVNPVVSKQPKGSEINGIAYDPMTGVLYWTNGRGGAVWWIEVTRNSVPQVGQPLFTKEELKDQIPVGLAIDVCKRYLYWTNLNIDSPSIERSTVSGTELKAIVNTDLNLPNAIVVDQTSDRIYWADEKDGFKFRIESADMDGKNRIELYNGKYHQPFALAVVSGLVYWADHTTSSVWRIPLNSSSDTVEPHFVREYDNSPQALVSSQVGEWKRDHCNPVVKPRTKEIPARIIPFSTPIISPIPKPDVPSTAVLRTTCFNGGTYYPALGRCSCPLDYSGVFCEVDRCKNYCVRGKCSSDSVTCSCEEGFTGDRCEINRCHNFCVEGNCSFNILGEPQCSCNAGYMGQRCEVESVRKENSQDEDGSGKNHVCHNYCVVGNCSVDTRGQPRCHCPLGFSGDRCEVNSSLHQQLKDNLQEVCKEFCVLLDQSSKTIQPSMAICRCPEFREVPLSGGWPHFGDYTTSALLGICFVLILLVSVLVHRVLVLRRRPRIKKRIIVNKQVTPLTCRPNPSEPGRCDGIIIDGCCNMNICETPCFEPDFRQPEDNTSQRTTREGKDEKKSLLRNMELPPDDLY